MELPASTLTHAQLDRFIRERPTSHTRSREIHAEIERANRRTRAANRAARKTVTFV